MVLSRRNNPSPSAPAETSSSPSPEEQWFREHYDEAARQIIEFLEAGGVSLAGAQVADIGCGDGIIDLGLAHQSSAARIVGFDLRLTDSKHLAGQAARYLGDGRLPNTLDFKASETARIPAEDATFDVVVTWSAFEHIADTVGVAREMRRILKPGGVLFLQLWPFYFSERGSHLWEWFPEPSHHLLQHQDHVVRMMESSGVHGADHTRYMVDEFRQLNRLTLEELHRSLLVAGFRVARLELMTGPMHIPVELARYPLADLAISGVKLLAV